ncbi:galactose-1-phosphate uridylyltransferase [Streptomyces subrutilus]|uniref:Galactose-1-phosphate uridylyltransferase n=1 Tax=Streptomyces subrutilus TaxID=36818 RepID=A0A1E5PZ67_9ACTN|nr:galactose-1-phosphate uridylyltransferase [Streptomyces subrutilus]OEJ34855.1 galactose-1-phosphate uridylyltransferase [Streptomyces subrutilus]
MKRTSTHLADGREILYYDTGDGSARALPDTRPLGAPATASTSEVRRDPLLGDSVVIASHRQDRTYHPPADACPLCPSTEGRASEIPAPDYEVAVFENRFPSLAGDTGRCEVICFTPDHRTSFAQLDEERAALVLAAWTDRTAELSAREGVRQVYCFENRGSEIGVTLAHPHGQIYAFPFVTPRTTRMLATVAAHRERTGGNLFEEVLAAERAEGSRVVLAGEHWTAFVPYAARWPYEVHLYPHHRVPDLPALGDAARAEFPRIYLEVLRRFDRLFGRTDPTPYISAWHQAPLGEGREDFALHLELFTVRRTADKLKYLAGTESGMEAYMNDVRPEDAAARLREVASP